MTDSVPLFLGLAVNDVARHILHTFLDVPRETSGKPVDYCACPHAAVTLIRLRLVNRGTNAWLTQQGYPTGNALPTRLKYYEANVSPPLLHIYATHQPWTAINSITLAAMQMAPSLSQWGDPSYWLCLLQRDSYFEERIVQQLFDTQHLDILPHIIEQMPVRKVTPTVERLRQAVLGTDSVDDLPMLLAVDKIAERRGDVRRVRLEDIEPSGDSDRLYYSFVSGLRCSSVRCCAALVTMAAEKQFPLTVGFMLRDILTGLADIHQGVDSMAKKQTYATILALVDGPRLFQSVCGPPPPLPRPRRPLLPSNARVMM